MKISQVSGKRWAFGRDLRPRYVHLNSSGVRRR